MLALAALCFSLLCSAVLGLPLTERDVVNPHITNPRPGTIWVVGMKELVTWETDNLPPKSQITNPNGRVILGFEENDSLNLQLDNPLANGFSIFDGNVTITVPNVPPRDDYIIVLMGDSGNASPAFAITSIQGGSSSSSTRSSSGTPTGNPNTSSTPDGNDPSQPNSTDPPSSSSFNSPPFTGSTITGGASTSSSSGIITAPGPVSLASSLTLPSNPASQSSSSATTTGSAAPASSSTSAAWPVYRTSLWSVLAASLAITLLI